MLRSLLMKAQTGWSVPDNVTTSTFTIMTTPSAPLRRLRVFFLLAQPPLLFQEGNALSWQFIHTFPVCARFGGFATFPKEPLVRGHWEQAGNQALLLCEPNSSWCAP